jgi:catechol 2,3-dioxygenase-like lactoylglutathione lyase family enzyme
MTMPVRSLVPMAFVADVTRSIAYYERLGFRVHNTVAVDGGPEPTWAWLQADGAALMVARATEPVIASQQAVLFYLYVEDVAAKHAELAAAGTFGGPITYPFYAARGEFRLHDPDGYVLMVTHT